MERLWAPWRSAYIGKKQGEGCVFCEIVNADSDEENYVLWRGKKTIVLLNLYPYNNGHLLIIPKRHVADIRHLDEEELLEVGLATQRATGILELAFNPEGYNIGANMGKAAGAGIPGHFHVHVVPRWLGDTNFMPTLGDVKVVSEGLSETYKKISESMTKDKI